MYMPPAATVSSARTRLSSGASLSTKPRAPRRGPRSGGPRRRSRSRGPTRTAASCGSGAGRPRSHSAAACACRAAPSVGRRASTSATASSPWRARPTTRTSCASRYREMLSRTAGWSSATTHVGLVSITPVVGRRRRDYESSHTVARFDRCRGGGHDRLPGDRRAAPRSSSTSTRSTTAARRSTSARRSSGCSATRARNGSPTPSSSSRACIRTTARGCCARSRPVTGAARPRRRPPTAWWRGTAPWSGPETTRWSSRGLNGRPVHVASRATSRTSPRATTTACGWSCSPVCSRWPRRRSPRTS